MNKVIKYFIIIFFYANAYSEDINKCDKFAAISEVEHVEDIKAEKAIKFCHQYVDKFPKNKNYVFQLARGYYSKEDFKNSFIYNKRAADLGSAMAMNNLALQYEFGQGIKRDIPKAIKLYEKAINLGNTHSLLNLGTMYEEGNEIIAKNIKEAIRLYSLAAQKGDSYGDHYIAMVYDSREGIENKKTANEYYRKAAKKNNRDAIHMLGINYYYGLGVNKDEKNAYQFLSRSSKLGNTHSMVMKAELFYENKKEYQKALQLLRRAENLGNSDAINKIGYFYENGWVDGNEDYAEAMVYYMKAEKLGHADASNNLGVMYEEGLGVIPDIDKAILYYEKAAELESTYAMNNLALLYMYGNGVEKNLDKALVLLRNALNIEEESLTFYNMGALHELNQNYKEMVKAYKKSIQIDEDPDALYALGLAYEYGNGVKQDDKKAFEFVLKAAEKENIDAINWIGAAYMGGIGVARNYDMAIKYYKEAAALGDTFSMNNLGVIYVIGDGVDIDYKKAFGYFTKSSELGNHAGTYLLADLYRDGLGVKADPKYALKLYKLAGNGGDLQSMIKVADMYRFGVGTEPNLDEATKWYKKVLDYKEDGNYLNNNLTQGKTALSLATNGIKIIESLNKNIYNDIDFGTYYAVLIGNKNYQNLDKLNNSINDVREIKNLLEDKYNYNVTLIEDADEETIWKQLYNLRSLKEEDNLLIYYSGHGIIDKETDIGYWLPVDADPKIPNRWISDIDIKSNLRAIRAKHIMVIADSCFSGKLLRNITKVDLVDLKKKALLQRLLDKKIRVALTSGGEEPVLDSGGGKHSIFAKHLIDILKKNSNILPGNAVYNTLKEELILNAQQTPRYNFIQNSGSQVDADYVFVPKKFLQ